MSMSQWVGICFLFSLAVFSCSEVSENDDTILPENAIEAQKEYKDGTQEFREILLKGATFPMTPSGFLLNRDPDWFLQGSHLELKRVAMKGISNATLQRNFIYLKSDGADGQWHRFSEVPEACKQFLSTLPMQYDDTRLSFDGQKWYVRDENNNNRKLVEQIEVGNNNISAISEDGKIHSFENEVIMEELGNYVKRLPKAKRLASEDSAENVNTSSCSIATRSSFTLTCLNSFKAAITSGFNMKASDAMAVMQNKTWYIEQDGKLLRMIRYGLATDERRRVYFAMTEDGNWHRFLNAPVTLVHYLVNLPTLHYYGGIASDGKAWYVRNNLNKFRKLVKFGTVDYHIVTAMSEDDVLHTFHLNSKYSNMLLSYLFRLPVIQTSTARIETSNETLQKQESGG